jgi:hypothetical protein
MDGAVLNGGDASQYVRLSRTFFGIGTRHQIHVSEMK